MHVAIYLEHFEVSRCVLVTAKVLCTIAEKSSHINCVMIAGCPLITAKHVTAFLFSSSQSELYFESDHYNSDDHSGVYDE